MKIRKAYLAAIAALVTLVALPGTVATGYGMTPLNETEAALVLSRLIPAPKSIALGDKDVLLDKTLRVTLEVADARQVAAADSFVRARFKHWFGSEPAIKAVAGQSIKGPEAYRIEASGKEMKIAAGSLAGIRYAMSTLRQLAEVVPGTKTVSGWFVPELKLDDAPAMKFRGLHLCWFPETEAKRIEQGIRMAAYYKFNYVVIEFWGVYPYKTMPELAWAEHCTSETEVRRLVKLGHELGVTLIPQFNLFGHASASRGSTGKHVLLDMHPEYMPLFEPDGWTWCLSNPETRKLITGIVGELLDLYDNPPYFHIGCDEASSAGTCKVCRSRDYRDVFFEHLDYFGKLLKEKGARPLMWHDMLLRTDDPRWNGYVRCGSEKTDGLFDRLPKEFVICDWQYSAPKKGETWPTTRFFKGKNFDVVLCPWHNIQGIESQGRHVIANDCFGMLCTTWHHFYGRDMYRVLTVGATSLWGTPRAHRINEHDIFSQHLRQIGWEIQGLKYNDTGTETWQILRETYGPM